MRREIGRYTVESTNDLITINERTLGTIWGKTFPLGAIRKHFNEVCNKIELRIAREQEQKSGS